MRRLAMAAGVVALLGVLATLASGDLGATADRQTYRTPSELAALLEGGAGSVVLDEDGKPLLDKFGKPLRVGRDGRTVVDSRGRAVTDRRGRPLHVGGGTQATPDPDGEERPRDRGRSKQRPKKKRGRTPGSSARDSIVIGIAYNDAAKLNEVYARYGGHARASDGGSDTRAVADYINATGGIGGRKLELRLREYDTTDGRPYDVTFAEVCNTFAEGRRPLVVITIANDDELAPCLASKNIPLINDWPMAGRTAFQTRFPSHFFQPGSLALDRFAAPYVETLVEQGFFRGSGVRVGLLRYSDVETDAAVDGALRPALKAAGITITSEQAVPASTSVNDISGLITRIGTAIVRFRAAGVNRVISVDNRGDLIGLFMQAAEPAGYRPRYGLSSLNSPVFLRASLPPDQMRGSVGFGWSPITDVAAAQDVDVNETRSRCTEIFRRAGVQELGDRSAYGQYGAYSRCSNLLLLRGTLAGVDVSSPAQLRAALEAAGARHQSAVAMSTTLSAARHDGAASFRLIRFEDDCACFRYHGALRRF